MKSIDLVIAAALLAAVPTLCSAEEPGPKPDELFQQLDKNKDGSVSTDEIGDEQKQLFERLVRRGDKDSDGKLTKDEFMQGFKQPQKREKSQGGSGERGGRGPGAAFDPDAMFDRLDKNGDEKLTLDELPEQARERMAAMFEQLGTDEVSKDEFRKIAGERRKRFAGGEGGPLAGGPPRDGDEAAEGDGPPAKGAPDGDDGPGRRGFGKRRNGPGPDGAGDGEDGPPRRGPGQRAGREMRVPKLVELLDSDQDRKISKDELAKAAEMFDKLDTNKDGSLDMAELLGPPPGNRRGEGGPQGGPGDGPRRRRPRDGGPRDGGSPPGGPEEKGAPGDNPPPGDGGPKDESPEK